MCSICMLLLLYVNCYMDFGYLHFYKLQGLLLKIHVVIHEVEFKFPVQEKTVREG